MLFIDQQQAQEAPLAPVTLATPKGPAQAPGRRPWLELGGPRGFHWSRYELPVPGLPTQFQGLRILHLSDLHIKKKWRSQFDELISRIGQEAPDLILITGDFVESKHNHSAALPHVLRLVAELKAPLGCFGTLGNHDRYSLEPELDGSGVMIIEGRRHVIERDEAQLELIGLPGVEREDLTIEVLDRFPPRQFGVPRIVLSHFPDHLRKAAALRPDLFLAGHTHGGQVCLPGGYPILRHDSLPRRLCRGVHRVANTWLVVTRGLGSTDLPIRLFCPPQVIELTLTRG